MRQAGTARVKTRRETETLESISARRIIVKESFKNLTANEKRAPARLLQAAGAVSRNVSRL